MPMVLCRYTTTTTTTTYYEEVQYGHQSPYHDTDGTDDTMDTDSNPMDTDGNPMDTDGNPMDTDTDVCPDCPDGYLCQGCLLSLGDCLEFMDLDKLRAVQWAMTTKYHDDENDLKKLLCELTGKLNSTNHPDTNFHIIEVLLTNARRLFGLCIKERSDLNGLLEHNNVADNMKHTYAVTWLENHLEAIETAYQAVCQAYSQRDLQAFNRAIERLIASCSNCN
jgi:hypothetical protein